MHLLVPSAFRSFVGAGRLVEGSHRVSMHLLVLSAFRRVDNISIYYNGLPVSMHLLVLSAFRRTQDGYSIEVPGPVESQCTFWCSVLSDSQQ